MTDHVDPQLLRQAADMMETFIQDPGLLEEAVSDLEPAVRMQRLELIVYFLRAKERPLTLLNCNNEVRIYELLLRFAPLEYPDIGGILNNLGSALMQRFTLTKENEDRERALSVHEEAVARTPETSRNYSSYIHLLGEAYYETFRSSGSESDLEQVIQKNRKALETTAIGDPRRQLFLTRLVDVLWIRYRRDPSHAHLADVLHESKNLTEAYGGRFPDSVALRMIRNYDDDISIDEMSATINSNEQALEILASDDSRRSLYQLALATGLEKRHERSQAAADLERAIALYTELSQRSQEEDVTSRFVYHKGLGRCLQVRFDTHHDDSSLHPAIETLERAVDLSSTNEDRFDCLLLLAPLLLCRYQGSLDLQDLEYALAATERAVAIPTEDSSGRAVILHVLGDMRLSRFQALHDPTDLDKAVDNKRMAFEVLPENSPDRHKYLHNWGHLLEERYESSGKRDDLDKAIDCAKMALASISELGPQHHNLVVGLRNRLMKRFKITKDKNDLECVIEWTEKAAMSTVGSQRISHIMSKCQLLNTRFEITGDLADLKSAIEAGEAALKILPETHADRLLCLQNLSVALFSSYSVTYSVSELEKAIELCEKAVASCPDDDPLLFVYLNGLGSGYSTRFRRFGDIDDLNRSIELLARAVACAPSTHPLRPSCLHNYGFALLNRYEFSPSVTDLQQIIALSEEGLRDVPADDVQKADLTHLLSLSLRTRAERLGSFADLERAVQLSREAMSLVPEKSKEKSKYLNSYSNALFRKFEIQGSVDDLDEAIQVADSAVSLTPKNNRERLFTITNSLGNVLRSRYDRLGAMEDLDRAIEVQAGICNSATPEDRGYAGYLNNLSIKYRKRFNRKGNREDLDKAIDLARLAIEFCPPHDDSYPGYNYNSGNTLQRRFEITESLTDLDDAVEAAKKAVESTSLDHPDRSLYLNGLAEKLVARFGMRNEESDLTEAIRYADLAVKATSLEHQDLAVNLETLASSLRMRYNKHGSSADRDRAIATYEQGAEIVTASAITRINCAYSAAQLVQNTDINRANVLYKKAVQLLPALAPRSTSERDIQFRISRFSRITATAVSVALECGDNAGDTLELLEQGRGIVSSLQLDVKSDITTLESEHPKLAQDLLRLRLLLDRGTELPGHSGSKLDYEQRRQHSKEYDELLINIRNLPGYGRFLRGPSKEEMCKLACEGYIIVFNVSNLRSDVFIVSTDGIRTIPLPKLTHAELIDQVARFLTSVSPKLSNYNECKLELIAILEWLWDTAIGCILEELGYTDRPKGEDHWPRLWWVGSGALTLLPIHAAGYHFNRSGCTTLDRVISSFLPTVKALAFSRQRAARTSGAKPQKVMLIEMTNTPGQQTLKFAKAETDALDKFCRTFEGINVVSLKEPTTATVLSRLREQNYVHFACHGISSLEDPSLSELFLADWQTTSLTVSALTALNIQPGQFAYLSACQTATSYDPGLLDEYINISSAMLLAGYSAVIGTQWAVDDEASSIVATEVYSWMLSPSGVLDPFRSAEGLHRAIHHIRNRKHTSVFKVPQPPDPLIWAPYIHLGV